MAAISKADARTRTTAGVLIDASIRWLGSELRRFHIGISLALLVLAASILVFELAVTPQDSDRLVLAAALAIVVVPGARIGFPFLRLFVPITESVRGCG